VKPPGAVAQVPAQLTHDPRAHNAKLTAALRSAATRLAETNDRIHDKHS
jgi:hypothetical protein